MTTAHQNSFLDIVSKGSADFSFGDLRLDNVELLAIHLDASFHEFGHVVLKDADTLSADGGHPLTSNAFAPQ
eukprot:14035831-Alexandrium_andersonii.AAC.1